MKLENESRCPRRSTRRGPFCWTSPGLPRLCRARPSRRARGEEGEYKGQMKIKIGPITASYKGTVKIQEADEAAHRVAMRAQAKDARGQGTAAATITSTMEEVADGTKIHVTTDMRVTGPAAQFGRGVMQDVSAKLMTRFAECLAEQMQASPDVATTTEETADVAVPAETAPADGAESEAAATAAAPETATAAPTRRIARGRVVHRGRGQTASPGASSGVSSAAAEPTMPSVPGHVVAPRRGRRTTCSTSARRAVKRCSSGPPDHRGRHRAAAPDPLDQAVSLDPSSSSSSTRAGRPGRPRTRCRSIRRAGRT